MITASSVPRIIGSLCTISYIIKENGDLIKADPQPCVVIRNATLEEYLSDPQVTLYVDAWGKDKLLKLLEFHNRKYFYEVSTD
jgi:hypothetical protein